MKQWKAIFLDFDGTVFSHRTNCIPFSAMEAIQKARKRGVFVFVATGRHIRELDDFDLTGFTADAWITMNGALCFKGDTVYSRIPIDKQDQHVLYTALQNDPFPVIFLEEDRMYMNMHDVEVERQQAEIHTSMPPVLPLSRILEKDIYQFIPWVKDERWIPVEKNMKHVQSVRWTDLALDVLHENCGKDVGVLRTCKEFGIDPADTIAIGDGPNDLPLLKTCGIGIAMGNADMSLKEEADDITDDIDDNGLEKALLKYGAIGV